MQMFFYVLAFAVIGLLAGLIFRKYQPASASPSVWISSLMGVLGSLITGLITLMVVGYRRLDANEPDYNTIYSEPYWAMAPAYWISLAIAPLGALVALIVNRLLRARQLRN